MFPSQSSDSPDQSSSGSSADSSQSSTFNADEFLENLFEGYDDSDPEQVKNIFSEIRNTFGRSEDLEFLIRSYNAHSNLFTHDNLTKKLCKKCDEEKFQRFLNIAANHVEDSSDCLALLVNQAINTSHEIIAIKFIIEKNILSFHEPIIDDHNDDDSKQFFLITRILSFSNDDTAVKLALQACLGSVVEQEQIKLLSDLFNYVVFNIKNARAMLRLVGLYHTHIAELGINDELQKIILDKMEIFSNFIEDFQHRINDDEISFDEDHASEDPETSELSSFSEDAGGDSFVKMARHLQSFCVLFGLPFMDSEIGDVICRLDKLYKKLSDMDLPSEYKDVPGVNPVIALDKLLDSFKELQSAIEIFSKLIAMSKDSHIEGLEKLAIEEICKKIRMKLAGKMFRNFDSLVRVVPGVGEHHKDFPEIEIDFQVFEQVIIRPFCEEVFVSFADFEVLANILQLYTEFEDEECPSYIIHHRQYSGPKEGLWCNAPVRTKYVTATMSGVGYKFMALPLISNFEAGKSYLTLAEKIELALLSSLFYHLHKEKWEDKACQELIIILRKINSQFVAGTARKVYQERYKELEQKDYYSECLSEDSEPEHIEAFNRETIRVQNALLTSAEKMMRHGQVESLWTSDKKKLKKPSRSKAKNDLEVDDEIFRFSLPANSYDLTARAEIHHDELVSAAVQNDLSLLNEYAIRGTLTAETLKEIKAQFYIAQYRGFHYKQDRWAQQARREDRASDKTKEVLYAPAVYKKAGLELTAGSKLSEAGLKRLQQQGELLKHQIDCLGFTGSLASNLSSSGSNFFTTATEALQDFYTKKYDEHSKFFEKINEKKQQQVILRDPLEVAMLYTVGGENYLNSTGDTPYHPLRYAFGMKAYSFNKRRRLAPNWHQSGLLERPYVGKVDTILFDLSSYLAASPRHLVSLNHHRGVAIDSKILNERETSFPAYLPEKNIIEKTIIRFPSFSQEEYNPYYQHQYGMNKELYLRFREDLLSSSPGSKERLRAEYLIIEHLCAFQEACLIEDARQIAKRKGGLLIYRDRTGGFSLVPPRLIPEDSPEYKKYSEGQARKLEERQKQKPEGWLYKLMQTSNVLPGVDYKEVLKKLLPSLKDHMTDEVLDGRDSGVSEADWQSCIVLDAQPLFNAYVREYFQDALNEIFRIAQRSKIKITIKSFLFERDLIINPDGEENSLELLYLGGDGFHGIVSKTESPKKMLAASSAVSMDMGSDVGEEAEETEEAVESGSVSSAGRKTLSKRAAGDLLSEEGSEASRGTAPATKQTKLTNFFRSPAGRSSEEVSKKATSAGSLSKSQGRR